MDENKIQEIQEYDSDKIEKYVHDTAYKTQDMAAEETFEYGTVKVTEDYAKQAVLAVQTRIEGTAPYTKEREERIKKNYELYDGTAPIKDAEHQVFIKETYNAVEDWKDDLYEIFSRVTDAIELEENKSVLERFLPVKLESDEGENDKPEAMKKSIIKQMAKTAKDKFTQAFNRAKGDREKEVLRKAMEMLDQYKDENVYYFQNMDIVKQVIIDGFDKAQYKSKVEEINKHGLMTGLFLVKKTFEPKSTKELKLFKEDNSVKSGQYLSFGKFKKSVKKESIFNFYPVNPEKVIFRKEGLEHWIIEKVDTQFWELLNATIGADGKSKENALYDYNVLKGLEEQLYKSDTEPRNETDEVDKENARLYGKEDVAKLDGDVLVYEAHNIPFRYKVADLMHREERGEVVGMSPDTEVTMKSVIVCLYLNEQYVPIRIQPEPWELPYNWTVFAEKKDDAAGMGLPEVLEKAQDLINTDYNLFLDLLNMALKGIAFVDRDKIQNEGKLSSLRAGDMIDMKDLGGRKIEEVIQFFRPPLEAYNSMSAVMEFAINQITRTSRKGPSGEKIQPNPSATEAFNIIQEMEKSVNRAGMRQNNEIWVPLAEDMYIYTLLNREEPFPLKIAGYKLADQAKLDPTVGLSGNIEQMEQSTKWVEVSSEDVYVDGLAVKIRAVENAESQTLEKQQNMQFLTLVKNTGLDVNPETGQPVVYTDETGASVVMDTYQLVNNVAKHMGQDNLWKKHKPQPIDPMSALSPVQAGVGTQTKPAEGAPDVPRLDAAPMASSLLNQAAQV